MSMNSRIAAQIVLFMILGLAQAVAQNGQPATSNPATSRPTDLEVYGRLQKASNIAVLEVWGTPEQAGYAHGFLLAPQIIALFDDFGSNPMILGGKDGFDRLRTAAREKINWKPEWEQELSAMLRGMRDRLGEENVTSRRLKRAIDVDDLKAVNALSDFRGLGCSTISVWGELTIDGEMLTARNLDYPYTELMIVSQMILIHRNGTGKRSWATVTWPGLIGAFSAINTEGVTAMLHDAPGLAPSIDKGFSPRSLAMRDAIESTAASGFIDAFHQALKSHRFIRGNAIHVSAPGTAKNTPEAVVFECDGNEKDGGVTIRRPEGDAKHQFAVYCTNHMRSREPAAKCQRFGKFDARIQQFIDSGKLFDGAMLLNTVDLARQSDTILTVVAEPLNRVFYVRIPGIAATAARFELGEWFRRPAEKPVRAQP